MCSRRLFIACMHARESNFVGYLLAVKAPSAAAHTLFSMAVEIRTIGCDRLQATGWSNDEHHQHRKFPKRTGRLSEGQYDVLMFLSLLILRGRTQVTHGSLTASRSWEDQMLGAF